MTQALIGLQLEIAIGQPIILSTGLTLPFSIPRIGSCHSNVILNRDAIRNSLIYIFLILYSCLFFFTNHNRSILLNILMSFKNKVI